MESEEASPPEAEETRSHGLTRRLFLGGAIGLGVVAAAGAVGVGVPLISRAINPPPGKLVTSLLGTPDFTVAHRGGSDNWPEMSMFAYRNAVAHGVNALEMSLARSSDGVWFGLHDATLDRTSGTSGFVAAEHTWAEISRLRITAAETTDPSQPTRPYLRFEDLATAYATTHTVFVDPKVVPPRYFPELFGIMDRIVTRPTQSFIAKGYCTSAPWAHAARERGYRSWGYYYGAQVDADPNLLPSTQALWNLLGMDFRGSNAAWAAAKSYRKKVIGHIIGTKHEETTALDHGAAGLVVSGITEVLG